MIKGSRYILMLTVVVVCSVFLPKLYCLVFDKPEKVPFVHYSCVTDDFTIYHPKQKVYHDTYGNYFTKKEYQSLLPLVYMRQLMADGVMPDTLRGVPTAMSTFTKTKSLVRIKAKEIASPQIKLQPLFESESEDVALSLPDDVFRIGWRMEFIDAATNEVDEEKSRHFSAALYHHGFKFPATHIAGLPTIRKSCDEGYFVVDEAQQLFHLKMVKGLPYVKHVMLPKELRIKHIKCVDFKDKVLYGFIVSGDNKVYALSQNDYVLWELPIDSYVAEEHQLTIKGDYFHYNIAVLGEGFQKTFATDRNFNLIDTYTHNWLVKEELVAGKIKSAIFPFEIAITSPESDFVKFYLTKPKGGRWLLVNMVWLFLYVLVIKRKGESIKCYVVDFILIALTGIYGVIAVSLMPKKV